MNNVSLIIPVSDNIPNQVIHDVCQIHLAQTTPIDIIVSKLSDELFSLAKSRNNGVRHAVTEWIMFADVDSVFDRDLLERMLDVGSPIVLGATRADVPTLGDIWKPVANGYYRCSHVPMLMKRSLFEDIGGYCEQYVRWGYEDSDFQAKIPEFVEFDSKSYHVLEIHNLAKSSWAWSGDHNRELFMSRLKIPVSDRIEQDKKDW